MDEHTDWSYDIAKDCVVVYARNREKNDIDDLIHNARLVFPDSVIAVNYGDGDSVQVVYDPQGTHNDTGNRVNLIVNGELKRRVNHF
jgi:hypothetical protein